MPEVQRYWSLIRTFITKLTTILIPQKIEICLLGLVDALIPSWVVHILLGLLLFYARKLITLKWRAPTSALTLNAWKSLVNLAVPLYKETYYSRGYPLKFQKVWNIWLESETTTVEQEDPVGIPV